MAALFWNPSLASSFGTWYRQDPGLQDPLFWRAVAIFMFLQKFDLVNIRISSSRDDFQFSKDNKVKAWIFPLRELNSRGCGKGSSCQIHMEINHMGDVRCFWVGCKHHSSHLFTNCLLKSALHSSPYCNPCILPFEMVDLIVAFVESTEQREENAWVGN